MSRSVFLSLLAVAVVATVGTTLWATPTDSPRQLLPAEMRGIYGGWIDDKCCGAATGCGFGDQECANFSNTMYGVCVGSREICNQGGNSGVCVFASPMLMATCDTTGAPDCNVCCESFACDWDWATDACSIRTDPDDGFEEATAPCTCSDTNCG